MFVQREFKLMGERTDLQYVSSIDAHGRPTGYDSNIKHALYFNEWQHKRVTNYLNEIKAKHHSSL